MNDIVLEIKHLTRRSGAFTAVADLTMPITTAMMRIANKSNIDFLSARCTSQAMMPLAEEQIASFLRNRHIGIRKAIGATPRDILLQFLIESAIISLIGGLLGIVIGVLSAVVLSSVSGWNTIISSSSVVLALGVSAGIGIFFGIYPASKAAALHPIEALRYE